MRTVDELIFVTEAWREERRSAGQPPLDIGFAVATGPVVFGAVGDPNRREYTVTGDPVSLAAKLEKHNKIAGVAAITTAEAFDTARSQGYVPPQPRRSLEKSDVGGVEFATDLIVLADRY